MNSTGIDRLDQILNVRIIIKGVSEELFKRADNVIKIFIREPK